MSNKEQDKGGYHQGKYRPLHPEKYKGDPRNIVYRSSWERTFSKWCDLNENIVSWQSEEKCLWYYDPVSKKKRRYFPDYIIQIRESDGLIVTKMIEIKPHKQVIGPPTNPKRKTKSWASQVYTHITNEAKWAAAREICEERGWEFVHITEYDLGIKKRK